MRMAWLLSGILLVAACGDDQAAPSGPDGGGDPPPDAAVVPGAWVPLIEANWNLSAGDEGYICATRTLPEDLYVGAIRPIAPTGTHHTVVSLRNPDGPDDPGSPCGPGFGMFYASGVGTQALVLPDGVGLVARKGQQVWINLHLFNASDQAIAGTSGVEVLLLDPAKVQHEASISFHGPLSFRIPASGSPVDVVNDEFLPAGRTIFAIFPHMHQIGSHFRAEIVRGGAPVTLWNDDYQFESQEFQRIPEVVTQAGDAIKTTCTFVNSTGHDVGFGDSSTAEMCFSIIMSY
jgi:Copper type II ascorbate-dependent monooxygenase, C-terminal domain